MFYFYLVYETRRKPVDIHPVYDKRVSVFAHLHEHIYFDLITGKFFFLWLTFCFFLLLILKLGIFIFLSICWNNHSLSSYKTRVAAPSILFKVKFHLHLEGLFTRQPSTHRAGAMQHMPFRCNLALNSRSRSQSVRKLVFLFLCHTDRVRDE